MLEVRESKVGGDGVFATQDIPKGTFIHTLVGVARTERDFDLLPEGEEAYNDPLQIYEGATEMDRVYIDLDEFSRSFNHSCDPNGGIRNVSDLYAIKDIKAGDEITYDYSTVVGRLETIFSMECACGTERCRKIIGNIDTIPQAQLEEYKTLNALPAYIRQLLHI